MQSGLLSIVMATGKILLITVLMLLVASKLCVTTNMDLTVQSKLYFPHNIETMIDITTLFASEATPRQDLESVKVFDAVDCNNGAVFYYETDLDESITGRLLNVTNWIHSQKYYCMALVISLRYEEIETWTVNKKPIKIPKYLPAFMDTIISLDYIPALNAMSFQYTGILACHDPPYKRSYKQTQKYVAASGAMFLREYLSDIIDFVKHNVTTKIGYTLTSQQLDCEIIHSNANNAEFLIIKHTFETSKSFVESYGAFKMLCDSIHRKVMNISSHRGVERPFIFHHHRLVFSRSFYNQGRNLYPKLDTSFHQHSNATQNNGEVRRSIWRRRTSRAKTMYKCLFQKYLKEWRTEGNRSVIIDRPLLVVDGDCNNTHLGIAMPTPKVDRGFRSVFYDCRFWLSSQMFINSLVEQGFHSFLFDVGLHAYHNPEYTEAMDRKCRKAYLPRNMFRGNIHNDMSAGLYFGYRGVEEILFLGNQTIHGIPFERIVIDLPSDDGAELYSRMQALRTMTEWKFTCQTFLGGARADSDIDYSVTERATRASYLTNIKLFNASKVVDICGEIVLDIYMDFDSVEILWPTPTIYVDGVLKTVRESFLLTKEFIEKTWKNKTTILGVVGRLGSYNSDDMSPGLFCRYSASRVSEYFEAIFTWAEIYGIDVIVKRAPENRYQGPISWETLNVDKNVFEDLYHELPIHIRRSYNESKMFGKWTNGMYSCIKSLRHAPKSAIDFESGIIGSYVELDVRSDGYSPLRAIEIQTMFLFVMRTFHVIEIPIFNSIDVTNIIGTLLTQEFNYLLSENAIGKREMLITLQMKTLESHMWAISTIGRHVENYLVLVSHTNSNVSIDVGIQFSTTWLANINLFKHVEILGENLTVRNSAYMGLELSIEDCALIVKYFVDPDKYENIEDFAEKITKLNRMSYITCKITVPFDSLGDEAKLQEFLETHFYVKTMLFLFLPHLTRVSFKLNPIPFESVKEIGTLLILMNHLINFARSYNLHYFILPAFAPEARNTYSWWDISNYTDLFDVNIYRDIQSEYLQVETWRPTMLPRNLARNMNETKDESSPSSDISFNFTISSLVIAVAALLLVLVLVMIGARRNAILLSDEEVKEFIRGREEALETTGDDNDYNGDLVKGEFNNEYEISMSKIGLDTGKILGMGNFGSVFAGTLVLDNLCRQSIAVKSPNRGCDKQTFLRMLREIKLFCYLGRHENLVKFIGCYTKEIQQGVLYIVMELCSGGSLLSQLKSMKESKQIDRTNLLRFCREIASGMEYIASKNVIHGDLSARNVLLDDINICKISDFGLSRKLYESDIYKMKTNEAIPWRWMSYEVLVDRRFSVKSDVWSFGVTAWEIFSLGLLPYPGFEFNDKFVKALEEGTRLCIPPNTTADTFRKISTCWQLETDLRPSFSELSTFFAELLPYDNFL